LLACRHHIMALLIGAMFKVCMGATSSPEVPLFKRFQEYWGFIDTAKFEPGIAYDHVACLVEVVRENTIEFANKHLKQSLPRDDYKEFLELVIVFLGAAPARGVRFTSPGAMHHARWMSKVIYSLKIWIFKSQFKLTPAEERGLCYVCVYLQAWISAPLASCALYNDMLLLKSLLAYSSIHSVIAKSTAHKFSKHLWNLSQELVGLAFFDSRVSSSTKRLMVSAIQNEVHEFDHSKRLTVDLNSFKDKNLEDFVTAKSMKMIQLLELPHGFFEVDPDLWQDRDDFTQVCNAVESLKVVNDQAERGVALIQEYSGS
jgi:hypothetical protein